MNMPPLSHFYRRKIQLSLRGKGRFQLHDRVEWLGHTGVIVEVVKYGMYPGKHPKLLVRGYYREYESYVVEDERGKRWWPRVGNLRLLCNEEKEHDRAADTEHLPGED